MSENQKLLALLIDGENAQAELIPEILRVINEKYGNPIIKNIYGDFSQDQLKSWRPIATKYGIEFEHQFNVSSGKNASDIALVIDAMDMLYDPKYKHIDGFCLVSSDSDFTHLARRIKKDGLFVIGIGKDDQSVLKEAYDYFHTLEELGNPALLAEVKELPQPIEEISDEDLLNLLFEAYKKALNGSTEDGWVQLLDVKPIILELKPGLKLNTKAIAERLKTLTKDYSDWIEISEQQLNNQFVHRVRISGGSEVDKVLNTYNHAVEELKCNDQDGWVSLSVIGATLPSLFPGCNPLFYKGVKRSRLKKVIEEMIVDYPDTFELKTDGLQAQVRCIQLQK